MSRKLKIVLCLAGIFLAGAITGGLVTLRVARGGSSNKGKMADFVPRQLARLSGELDLSQEQQEAVEKILRRGAEEIGALRRESFTATGAKVREMNASIATLLTPEQAVKFEEFVNRQRERMRRYQQDKTDARRGPRESPRKGGGGEPPAPPPGP